MSGISPVIVDYISKYGYFTIFVLVFVQELGIPPPVPNELLLLFYGYLSSIGQLNFFIVFLTVVVADFSGTTVLYALFYNFGDAILKKISRFVSLGTIDKLKKKLSKRQRWAIFVGRLLPYVRGYTSVAAGLLKIPPKLFISTVIISAAIWSGGYVTLGRILGGQWTIVASRIGSSRTATIVTIAILLALFFGPEIYRRIREEGRK